MRAFASRFRSDDGSRWNFLTHSMCFHVRGSTCSDSAPFAGTCAESESPTGTVSTGARAVVLALKQKRQDSLANSRLIKVPHRFSPVPHRSDRCDGRRNSRPSSRAQTAGLARRQPSEYLPDGWTQPESARFRFNLKIGKASCARICVPFSVR